MAMQSLPPEWVWMTDLPGHHLCDTIEQAGEWVCGVKPDETVLEKSSHELLERFSWSICAEQFIKLTEEAGHAQTHA